MANPTELLTRIVSVEGITGNEGAILNCVMQACDELGLMPSQSPDGIVFQVEGAQPGPRILFCSHLDTIPAGDGWTYNPFTATVKDGSIYGRGAVDARAACTAIILAAHHLKTNGLAKGTFIGALSIGEEGNDPSLPRLLEKIGPVDGSVVGEPTSMNIATAQRGLIVLELLAKGRQGHAARTQGPNAALALAKDLVFLDALQPPRWHTTLGQIKITPTRISAGVADNVIPPLATAMVDVRTTPSYTHAELLDIVKRAVQSEVRVIADKWIPCEIAEKTPLVMAAKASLPGAQLFASDTTSDWVFLENQHIPAVKIGPGDTKKSHTADECISVEELEAGVNGYISLAKGCLESGFFDKE